MRVLAGDECGVLKECLPYHKKEKQKALPTNFSRRKGVINLAWTDKDQENPSDQQFASLHLDSTVTLWERSSDSKRSFAKYHTVREISSVFKNSIVTPTNRPLGLSASLGDRLVACNTSGEATILKPLAQEPLVHQISCISIPENGSQELKHPLLSCMAFDKSSNRLALGGKDRETMLFDIETTKQVFKCKNLPPHPQTLLAPLVWPSSIEFMGRSDSNGQLFAVGTAHHQVRIYDTRVARRPVQFTPDDLLEYRVTALCHDAENHEHMLFMADAAGTVLQLDLRLLGQGTFGRTPKRFVGPAGSIKGLAVRGNRLVATGLDRMLRVFQVHTAKEEECIYMKQRLSCLLLGRETWKEDDEDLDDGDIDQDDIVRDYVDSDQEDEEGSNAEPDSDGENDDEDAPDEANSSAESDEEGHADYDEDKYNDDDASIDEEESGSEQESSSGEESEVPDSEDDVSEIDEPVPPNPSAKPARKRQKR